MQCEERRYGGKGSQGAMKSLVRRGGVGGGEWECERANEKTKARRNDKKIVKGEEGEDAEGWIQRLRYVKDK